MFKLCDAPTVKTPVFEWSHITYGTGGYEGWKGISLTETMVRIFLRWEGISTT